MDEASLPKWSPNRYARHLAGVVPAELVLARNGDAAVFARRIDAYPTGWELEIARMSPGDRPARGDKAPWPLVDQESETLVRYWVWPLPTPGELTFTTWWPVRGIEAAQAPLAADLIIDAAGRSQEILPLGGDSGGAT